MRLSICNTFLASLLTPLLLSISSNVLAEETPAAVPLYTEPELIALINKNTHLQRVKADDCQLVQDIEARANKMALPSYQFLYGDRIEIFSDYINKVKSINKEQIKTVASKYFNNAFVFIH